MINRDLVINILLIVAGIVLAIALFGAGVLWKSKTATKTSDLALPISTVHQHVDRTSSRAMLWAESDCGADVGTVAFRRRMLLGVAGLLGLRFGFQKLTGFSH